MTTSRVTVVIPTYQRAAYLREAISSVLAQSYPDFVLRIFDDASQDDTAAMVAGFSDPRIHYFRHPTRVGLNRNWQAAMYAAETELVAPLADDDRYTPDHLARAVATLDASPDVAYYAATATFFGEHATQPIHHPAGLRDLTTPLQSYTPQDAVRFLANDIPGPINTMVLRRNRLHQDIFWGPDDYIPNDLLVMTQFLVQGGCVIDLTPSYEFRIHGDNASLISERPQVLRLNLMVWYGIRWLANFLVQAGYATPAAIEAHGCSTPAIQRHAAPLVLALASYDSPASLRAVAKTIFRRRRELDVASARLRLARRAGFWTIPLSERVTQREVHWHG
jgi:glycosyltransferase involved in cell wall biosynthesis